jgi:hypothetical protein
MNRSVAAGRRADPPAPRREAKRLVQAHGGAVLVVDVERAEILRTLTEEVHRATCSGGAQQQPTM